MARTEPDTDTVLPDALAGGDGVVLFDMDGVVLRDRSVDGGVYERAMADAAAEYDLTIEGSDRPALGRRGYDEAFVAACRAVGVDPVDFFATREAHSADRIVERVRDGRRRLSHDVGALDGLAERYDLGLASNNYHRVVRFVVDHFSLDAFAYARGRDPGVSGFERRKPDPHYLLDVLDALDADGGLYVGDRETDVVAARRAGLDSVFLRREHNAERRLSVDPTHELESLAELGALLDPGRRGSDGPALRSRSDRPGNG